LPIAARIVLPHSLAYFAILDSSPAFVVGNNERERLSWC
jgi:hypothetical protein